MARYLFLFLTITTSAFAQDFNYINRNANRSRNITNIDVSFRNDQYVGSPVSITATPNVPVFEWTWEIQNPWTHAVKLTSTLQNPTFTGLGTGYYDVVLKARNSIDYYTKRWKRAFVVLPARVSEGSAYQVVDISTGSDTYFLNFDGIDMSDKVIILKGSSANTFIHVYRAHATQGHPFIIQKSNDTTPVEWTGKTTPTIAPHAFLFEDCEYVLVNGFNTDGTNGIKVHGVSGSTQVVYNTGKFTNISLNGIDASSVITVDAAAVSFIPTFNSGCNINNWYMDSLVMYRVTVTNGGEEAFYIGENNQGAVGGFRPPMGRGMVAARCTVFNCGRDAIQPGGMIGFEVHDNDFRNWGKQKEASHESCISHNGGSAGTYQGNVCIGGKMFLNLQSGPFPYDVRGGETTARPTMMVGNIFANGVYDHTGGGAEAFVMYGQNFFPAGPGAWNFYALNNIFDTDLKLMEVNWASSSWLGTDWALVNNIVIKVGNAGTWEELNFVGDAPGSVTGTTVNNIVRERGSDLSDLYFNDYANNDYTITSFSSAAYQGSPTDLIAGYSELASYFYDQLWFPLLVPGYGYVFGPYTGYDKRTVTPP